eukprot:scaffold14019_cov57-Cyclotella_meneghiniana.AAC.2
MSWAGLSAALSPSSSHLRRRCDLCHHRVDIKHHNIIDSGSSRQHPHNTNYRKPESIRKRQWSGLNSSTNHEGIPIEIPEVKGVTLKMAFDASPLWGVAETSPTSERFTSSESLDMVHRLRRESCAVLVGRGTVERDDCSLTVRRVETDGDQPVRVVLDPGLKLLNKDAKYTILNDGLKTFIYHVVPADMKTNDVDIIDSVTLVKMKQHPVSTSLENSKEQFVLSPTEIVQDLFSKGINHIMVEGGPTTALQFLDAKLVDRAILVRSPIEFIAPIPAGFDEAKLEEAGLVSIGSSIMGGDTIEYWVRNGIKWPTPELSLWP